MKLSFFKRTSQDKKFQEVLDKLQKAAEQNPNDLRVRIKIAELYLEHNKKDKAIEEYLTAAKAYQEKRLFQIAVAIYKHIISLDAEQVDVYSELADLHLRNGFVGDSVAVLEKLANHYYEKDMKYEATQVLRKISEIDPENKFFKIKVAKFYENKDLTEEETLRVGPKDKWNLVEEHKDTTAQNTVTESFFDLEAALEDDVSINISTVSDNEEPHAAEITAKNMAPDTVFKELKGLIESEPNKDSPQFHFNLALAYQRCNQLAEAIDEFQTALDGLENKLECYLNLAHCSMTLKKFREAQDFVARGLKIDGLTGEEKLALQYQSALIYKAEGDSAKALKVFKTISQQNKNYKNVNIEIKKLSSQ